MAWVPITVVEVEPFPTRAKDVWSDEERLEFVSFIAWHPEAGDPLVGARGIRKVRWSRRGAGKRGGVRVIYYYHDRSMPLFLLTVYPKPRQDDLTPAQLRAVKRLAVRLKAAYEND